MTIEKIKKNISDNLGHKVRVVFNTGRNNKGVIQFYFCSRD